MIPLMIDPHFNRDRLKEFLQVEGWPDGLITTLNSSCSVFPLRFFVIDDSGSMNTDDGRRMISHGTEKRYGKIARIN